MSNLDGHGASIDAIENCDICHGDISVQGIETEKALKKVFINARSFFEKVADMNLQKAYLLQMRRACGVTLDGEENVLEYPFKKDINIHDVHYARGALVSGFLNKYYDAAMVNGGTYLSSKKEEVLDEAREYGFKSIVYVASLVYGVRACSALSLYTLAVELGRLYANRESTYEMAAYTCLGLLGGIGKYTSQQLFFVVTGAIRCYQNNKDNITSNNQDLFHNPLPEDGAIESLLLRTGDIAVVNNYAKVNNFSNYYSNGFYENSYYTLLGFVFTKLFKVDEDGKCHKEIFDYLDKVTEE